LAVLLGVVQGKAGGMLLVMKLSEIDAGSNSCGGRLGF